MKVHRVRSADPIDGRPERHVFVEVEKGEWAEVSRIPESHEILHASMEAWERRGKDATISERHFRIGGIKDWREEDPICE